MSTNPWGEPVVVYEDADGEVTVFRADPEAAEPEVVFPVGSMTMAPGEDWWRLVRRAERQHDTVFPDPAEVARAAALQERGSRA